MRESMNKTRNLFLIVLVLGLLSLNSFGQKLPESSIKTVYIAPFSHYDLGFVEPPDAVRERAARHIDEVIRVAEANKDFRWTIESVWQVEEWLKRQRKPSSVLPKNKEKIARLMNLIKSGQVALSTSWGSMHTDFQGAEEINRLTYGYAALHNSFGVSSQLAMLDDVPGHPTSLPNVLANSGTKYLVTGANLFLADATTLAPGKVPFWWEAPDGSRVLTWISQSKRGGYTEGMTDFFVDPYSLDPYTDKTPFEMFNPDLHGKKKDIEIMEIGITELLNRYNKAGYKYDAAMVLFAHDFVEPEHVGNLLRAVEMWNKKHDSVKLRVATPNDFFGHIEGKYASEIPTFKGEWSGLWSEAKSRSPRISAMARHTQDYTPAAETLWSALAMTRGIPAPGGNFSRLYDLLYTYDEHSGAGNNGWPQLNSIGPLEEQNRQYVRDMKAASAEVDRLVRTGIEFVAQPTRNDAAQRQQHNTRSVVIYNGVSWNRTDVIRLPADDGTKFVSIKTVDGGLIPFDTERDGTAVFVAKDVPALGYASFEITTAAGKAASTIANTTGVTVANGRYSIRLRADGNVESIRDLEANRELVNSKGERPFNDLVKMEGSDLSVVTYPVAPRITVQKGRVIDRIRVERERSIYPLTEITIYRGLDRVDVRNELDPRYEGFAGGDGNWGDTYYFAFPLNVGKDGMKLIRGGQKWFDMLPEDYLPGARKDAVTTRQIIGATDGRATALVAHRQSFHWSYSSFVPTKVRAKDAPKDFPAMYMGKFPLPEATIYARAFRNASQADTHDKGMVDMPTVEPGIDGRYVFDFAFSAAGVFDPVAAWRMGTAFNVPLSAHYTQVFPVERSKSFFTIDQPNVQIVGVKSLTDNVIRGEVSASPLNPPVSKVFIVRLQEFAGRSATVRVGFPVKIKSASLVTMTEDKVIAPISAIAPLTVQMKPFQTATVRVEIE